MKAKEVLEILGVSRVQLSYMVKKGELRAKTIENGRYDYDDNDVRALAEIRSKTLNSGLTDDSDGEYIPKKRGRKPKPVEKPVKQDTEEETKENSPEKLDLYSDPDIEEVNNIINSAYQNNFAIYFVKQREVMERIKKSDKEVTDDDLQFIMLDVPINLIDVSEALQRFKSSYEIIKLKVRENKNNTSADVLSLKLMSIAYNAVITRVESEISFSKELIMSSKKIWSARRATEEAVPVSVNNLPDYDGAGNIPKNSQGQLPNYYVN